MLQFAKKKRKRSDSGSDVDLDVTPPPSPKIGDDLSSEKRRSGRHTQRKKYVDDVDLNLSEDESVLMNLPPDVQDAASKDGAATAPNSGTATPKEVKDSAAQPTADNGKAPPPSEDVSTEPSQSGPNYAYVVSLKE